MVWKSGQSYSGDLRSRVLGAIDGGSPARATAQLFQVSVSYIYKALARREATGETEARPQRNRQQLKLAAHHAAIAAEVARRPDVTLEELRSWLLATHGVSASLGLMHKTLARLGLTLKKRMARPICKGDERRRAACINVSGLRAQALAKMDRARRGPHKERGAEHHILARLPRRRIDRYAICHSPPQTSCATLAFRLTLSLIRPAYRLAGRPGY